MRFLLHSAFAAVSLVGCAGRTQPASTPVASVAVSCTPIYLFEFQVTDEKGQLTSGGMAQVDAKGCLPASTDSDSEGDLPRFAVDASDPSRARFEALIAGERLELVAPVVPNLRIVVDERPRKNHAGYVSVNVTPFISQDVLKQTIKERFARAGIDVGRPPAGVEAMRPATAARD